MMMVHLKDQAASTVISQDTAGSNAPKKTPTPKLVMGHIEVITGDDMSVGIPYDEAVIHLEGDEDSEIEVRCPGALRLAPFIVKAFNSMPDVQFLLERLAEFDPGDDDAERDFHGHVAPAIARLRNALTSDRSE